MLALMEEEVVVDVCTILCIYTCEKHQHHQHTCTYLYNVMALNLYVSMSVFMRVEYAIFP